MQSLQSWQTLCDPMGCNPPGSFVHGILQARILEWIAMSSSRESSWARDGTHVSCIAGRVFTYGATWKRYIYIHAPCFCSSVVSYSLRPHGLYPTRLLCPWGFSRQENWSGLPFPSPGDLPNPGIEPRSPASQVDSLPAELPGKPIYMHTHIEKTGRN